MNDIQYYCSFSYFLLSHSLSIVSGTQKIKGEGEMIEETMKNDLTIKKNCRDARNRSFPLSICLSLQSASVINTFQGVQLTVQRPSAKETEAERTSKLTLQKL